MKAIVFHDIGDIRLDDVPEPELQGDFDAVVRITASAICGTDLHMVRGTMPGMQPGTILGHEGVGVVERVGPGVRNLRAGARVVIPSTIGCGSCVHCREGYYAQCDRANPNGKHAGTAFFGGPKDSGPFHGLQAEKARVPYAHANLVKIPDGVTDDQAILISDIFPTGWFGADLAQIQPGYSVAVFGCGPVGQFAIASAQLMGAGRVFAVDEVASRLDMARAQGAEIVDFSKEDPVETLLALTYGEGVDRIIDAVGVDANRPHSGPAATNGAEGERFRTELDVIAPRTHPVGDNWHPGDAPSQASEWAVRAVRKAGLISIIGVYPPTDRFFPIGEAMNKNLTLRMGNCNHRKYVPRLLQMVKRHEIDPGRVLTQLERLRDGIAAYEAFDRREAGWMKVELTPSAEY